MHISKKTCAIMLELLTVLCTDLDADISTVTGRDPRVSGRLEDISGKDINFLSANFKSASSSDLPGPEVLEILSISGS